MCAFAAFLTPAIPPLILPITDFFRTTFFTGAVTTVPELASLPNELVLVRSFVALVLPVGVGPAFRALVVAVEAAALTVADAFLDAAAAARDVFAFSTILWSIAVAPPVSPGAVGFTGEIGRVKNDLIGDGFVGERTRVRELADLGERILSEKFRVGGCSLASLSMRMRLLGLERWAFS